MKRLFIIFGILFCAITTIAAQGHFVYLTTSEVQIDSLLPNVGYKYNLPENYKDSIYSVTLAYPEFIDMSPSDIEQYNHLSGARLPEVPQPAYEVSFDRKKPSLTISVQPLAFRDGRYKWLTSFMLKIEATPVANRSTYKAPTTPTYAEHSVLASGKWGKIRVSDTGVHELTEAVIRQAGFSDINKVKIYGYGGNLQPEKITEEYIKTHDDLMEVPQCIVNGKHLFYAKGPVSWESATEPTRIRNFYSNYGYYLITQSDEAPTFLDETSFKATFLPTAYELNHSLYEKEEYAWYNGGRNLYDNTTIAKGSSQSYSLAGSYKGDKGKLHIAITSNEVTTAQIMFNDSVLGTLKNSIASYDKAGVVSKTYDIKGVREDNKVTVKVQSGGAVRLDYICLAYSHRRHEYDLTASHPTAQYVHNITNQDLHADPAADMVIIIPTSQKLYAQAKRLADYHTEHDGMRVRIVPADELYNEFSSGTPDGNAYRRYLKMLYDRAKDEDDMPKYLLLFGDCVWDNRMLSASTRALDPNDYLLCYETENSTNAVSCYVCDLWFATLDENEGKNLLSADLVDVAVGRFPVRAAGEAKIIVDKTIRYMENKNAGAWQNVIMFMGDDGNENLHMRDVNDIAERVMTSHPEYHVKKVMWDGYERITNSTGNAYPDVTALIKQQQKDGALIMDYAGHGSSHQVSHESVLFRKDFDDFVNENLPLWITASCDIMPFDNGEANIGESALLNDKGGAVAFFGTTRTVYATYNKRINQAYIDRVLECTDGKQYTIGEAHRLANNFLITTDTNGDKTENKLKYALIGDPALRLNIPKGKVIVDTINGEAVADGTMPKLKAGSKVQITGHIADATDFNGMVDITVRDTKSTIECRKNDTKETPTAFIYEDRTKTLFNGSDYVKDGQFNISFVVPMDINYEDGTGMMNLYAHNEEKSLTAHGVCEKFTVGGTSETSSDTTGPSIYCYLNSPSFVNGGDVNRSPFFVAQLNDEDGINVTGSSIGHDLMLIIDGEMSQTYNLNENFTYEFGSYTSGSTYFSLPRLEPGPHTLKFRAWDIFNNSSTTELSFNVVESLEPNITNISCTNNPASTETTFIVNHDRMDGAIDVIIEVMDMSGRLLWRHNGTGINGSGSYAVNWDLNQSNGQQLQTGVYLYRARLASEGSEADSKAKKLIILR